jgi:hypothetical protein
MFLWWDVVIAASHDVKVKTYWRNNIYCRYIYYISLRPSLFPIGSLAELLILRKWHTWKVQNTVEVHIETQKYPFFSKYLNSISWRSPFKLKYIEFQHKLTYISRDSIVILSNSLDR